jgi:hypothetical protein
MKTLLVVLFLAGLAHAEGKWCLQQVADEANQPVIILVNLDYQRFAHKADFPWLLEVNVNTLHQNRNGHPTDEEAPVLNALEDRLTTALSHATPLQFVGRATTKGHRELLYYVKDAEKANRLMTELAKGRQLRPWEYRISKDARWRRFDDLAGPQPECL